MRARRILAVTTALAAAAAAAAATACSREASERAQSAPPGAATATASPGAVVLQAPDTATLGDDPVSRSVRRGLALVMATPESLPRHVGSSLRCVSCHLDAGRRAYAMPWVGVYGRFPQYRSRSARVALIEERINECIRRSLNGTALPADGDDMRDIVAYMAWLSRGTPVGMRLAGSGIDSLVPLPGDTVRGREVYAQQCARCHAPDGGGMLGHPLAHPGPPLWGNRSFNIGSGMARVRVMAAFVHRHMPFDQPGTLTPAQSFDVAAFVTARPRPDYPGKARDWPRGDAPPDVAYATLASPRPRP